MNASQTLDLDIAPVKRRPFEHISKDEFVDPEVYEELVRTFPECPPSTGPTGHSYYWGDEEYDRLTGENPAWKAFFDAAQSQEYVDHCVSQFAETWEKDGCLIDLSKATYVRWPESREDKERRYIETELAPHELYVRLDIHQGLVGYDRTVHVDHRRRLTSMLVYFCDADEQGLEGGELLLHSKLGRFHPTRKKVKARHNLMVGFPCSPKSLHSVPEIRAQKGPRNFVQIQVSSSVDAWPE
jgi:hypothetical protein